MLKYLLLFIVIMFLFIPVYRVFRRFIKNIIKEVKVKNVEENYIESKKNFTDAVRRVDLEISKLEKEQEKLKKSKRKNRYE